MTEAYLRYLGYDVIEGSLVTKMEGDWLTYTFGVKSKVKFITINCAIED